MHRSGTRQTKCCGILNNKEELAKKYFGSTEVVREHLFHHLPPIVNNHPRGHQIHCLELFDMLCVLPKDNDKTHPRETHQKKGRTQMKIRTKPSIEKETHGQ